MKPALSGNRLTNQLDPHCQAQLLKYGTWVELAPGQELNEAGIAIEHVYFPVSGIITLMMKHAADKPIALDLIGREGMLGVIPALGITFVPYSAVVLAQGQALRIPLRDFQEIKASNPQLGRCLERYIAVLHAQFAQAAVCHALHDLEQRLARLLLTYSDRLSTITLSVTQELLATLLGVRRAGH